MLWYVCIMQSDFNQLPRRKFIKDVAATAAGVALTQTLPAVDQTDTAASSTRTGNVPHRKLGATGESVSIIGVGGHTMASARSEEESIRIVHGITLSE